MTCSYCDGQSHASSTKCTQGKGVSGVCPGTGTSNPPCVPCGPGTHRPDGTSYTNFQSCIRCSTGTYKAGNGTQNCGGCTNKPANSVYTAWAAQTVPSSNSCPWYEENLRITGVLNIALTHFALPGTATADTTDLSMARGLRAVEHAGLERTAAVRAAPPHALPVQRLPLMLTIWLGVEVR